MARQALGVVLVSLALAVCAPTTWSRSSEYQVDQVFAEYDRPDSPGCAVGVIDDGELVFGKGYGMASLEVVAVVEPTAQGASGL